MSSGALHSRVTAGEPVDVAVPASAAIPASLRASWRPPLRPVRVGPSVLAYLDRAKHC